MLVSLCAVVSTTSVSAAPNSSTNVQTPALVGNPIPAGSGPAVCAQDANSLDLFVRGADNQLWWRHGAVNGPNGEMVWQNWVPLGGILTSSPAAISRAAGTLEVFVRGTNGACYSKWTTDYGGTWSGWANLGGVLLAGTGPAASAREGGFDVFVIGTDHALWQKTWTSSGGTVNWRSLGGYLTSSPAAISRYAAAIEVFARGGNGALWSRYSTDNGASWSNWGSLGGKLLDGTGPAVSAREGGFDVFVIGTDHALWQKTWTSSGGTVDWHSLGGYLTSSPAATSRSSNTIDVFVRGGNGLIYWKEYSNSAWGGWSPGMQGP